MSELQMQVFPRTGIGVPSYFVSPWGEEWGPPVSEPSAEFVKPDYPGHTLNLWGWGAEAASLASISSDSEHTPTWNTTGFLEQ